MVNKEKHDRLRGVQVLQQKIKLGMRFGLHHGCSIPLPLPLLYHHFVVWPKIRFYNLAVGPLRGSQQGADRLPEEKLSNPPRGTGSGTVLRSKTLPKFRFSLNARVFM